MSVIHHFLRSLMIIVCLQTATNASEFTYEKRQAIGKAYICFMEQVGQLDSFDKNTFPNNSAVALFSSDCKKVENGTVIVESRKMLRKQLKKARNTVGKWTIETLSTIVSAQDKTCVLQFVWSAENLPHKGTTMVMLFLNENQKISCINEVWNIYQGDTLS